MGIVLTANKTLMVSTSLNQIYKVTQKGTHITLFVVMSLAHTSYQALITTRWLYWRDLEIKGEWMEAWTSANSVFHMEWQWMKQVTLALLLTWGAIRSEEWHSRADEPVVEVHAHFFCCNPSVFFLTHSIHILPLPAL